jgi:flagellar hook-associated protein 1 FlgK
VSIVIRDINGGALSGVQLVDGSMSNHVRFQEHADGTVGMMIEDANRNTVDLANVITSGAMKGFVDMINGAGVYARPNGNNFRGILYYQRSLDTFARTFANMMNRQNSIHTSDLPANWTPASVTQTWYNKNLFTSADGTFDAITASNIAISQEWLDDVRFLTTHRGDPVVTVWETDANGNQVYDINGDPVYTTTANSDNLNRFLDMLTGSVHFSGHGFRGSFQEFIISLQENVAMDRAISETDFDIADNITMGLADQRDAVSAVSIDEEAMNMMIYQNFYNAAARFMTTLDEALEQIIQRMGIVGR